MEYNDDKYRIKFHKTETTTKEQTYIFCYRNAITLTMPEEVITLSAPSASEKVSNYKKQPFKQRFIVFRAQKCIANHSCNGLNTLADSDTGTDSDANSCPMQKWGVGNRV